MNPEIIKASGQTSFRLTLPEPQKGKRTRDRVGKQRALLRAALQLFSAKGFEATSTREIAAAAGCAEGLIHRYFKGKRGLLPALIEDRMAEEMAHLGRRLHPAATLEKEFTQLVECEVDLLWKSREYLRVFIPLAMVNPGVRAEMGRSVLGVRVHAVSDRLRSYPESARLSSNELDALAESVGLIGFIFGFMRPVVLGQDRRESKKVALSVARMVVSGALCTCH